ncbi:hypothetical protein GGX14DRAFT_581579 [Mycena pura]|uniref:Uncharacterized protein n=1 Tax=Mycena pura TaxID=153505 RepID=A0AAD7E629_9AGAR|nr:hypothetical protein GGX14DRAFT_581579 [Mycena pura]
MTSELVLPPELERNIFETAAVRHPRSIPTLLRVARRCLVWIGPLLYRVVRGSNCSLANATLNAVRFKPAFLHDAVHHLSLDTGCPWSKDQAREVLAACTGIVDILIQSSYTTPALLPVLSAMRLQRLSASLEYLFGSFAAIDLTHPLFASLTHLDAFDETEKGEDNTICAQIPLLPALTHLCLNSPVAWAQVETLLAECPRLRVLAFVVSGPHITQWVQNGSIRDARLVVTAYNHNHWDYWRHWEIGAAGGRDVWAWADEFVAKKRSGSIEGLSTSTTIRNASQS